MATSPAAIEEIPRTEVERLLHAYLDRRIPGDRLKAELYTGSRIHTARRILEDDEHQLRARDPARFASLARIVGSGPGDRGAFGFVRR